MAMIGNRIFLLAFLSGIFFVYVVTGCVSGKKNRKNNADVENIIEKYEIISGYTLDGIFNKSKSYLLLKPVSKKGLVTSNPGSKYFYIIRVSDNVLLLEEEILDGSMTWINDTEIKIFYPSGIPGQEKAMIYNVNTELKYLKEF